MKHDNKFSETGTPLLSPQGHNLGDPYKAVHQACYCQSAKLGSAPWGHPQCACISQSMTLWEPGISPLMLPVESWARGYKTVLGAHVQLRAQTHISCSARIDAHGGYQMSWVRTQLSMPLCAYSQWRANEGARLMKRHCFFINRCSRNGTLSLMKVRIHVNKCSVVC